MQRTLFRQILRDRPLLLDGATGTELIKRGLPAGAPPEKWVFENPKVIQELHREYYAAGSDIVLACTFGLNRLKLLDHRLEDRVEELNQGLVEISRAVVPTGKFLFGDLSPTGQLVEPFGPLPFEECVDVYRQQAAALLKGGVDGFMIETMLDLQECRAALLAVREVAPDYPVLTGLTYEKHGKTIGGTTPEIAVLTLQALGADAVGCNCSFGPDEMLILLQAMLPYARVPLFIKPNAGMPKYQGGKSYYDLAADDFAQKVLKGMKLGARVVGGCCGTTPAHIASLKQAIDLSGPGIPAPENGAVRSAVCSSRSLADFSARDGQEAALRVIGERINPTGKKAFQAELLAGRLDRVLTFAEEQAEAGADLLDVNLGLGGIDEAAALRAAVAMLSASSPLPLVIDSVDPKAMEEALRIYPGRALVNSVSGENNRLKGILPLAAKYGAAIIVLPIAEGHIPATAAERLLIVARILGEAECYGFGNADVLVDGLAMTVSADPAAALTALETLRECRKRGLATLLGLSNISFGMPERKWLNAVFLATAMREGLTGVIANPSAELLMDTKFSADLILNRHGGLDAYLERFSGNAVATGIVGQRAAAASVPQKATSGGSTAAEPTPAEAAANAILKGREKNAAALARAAIASGIGAGELVNGYLVPAIVRAGEWFEKGKYFLPQLMLSGEAMRKALAELEPDLERERASAAKSLGNVPGKGRIVMATVKGDVHDIGKNLVTLMLKNHGYEVFDLGKDIPAAAVAAAARERKADIVGLSALMTTTLKAMRETVAEIRASGLEVKVMVGGAAVTEHFAMEAGADGYAPDAVAAVKLAADLMADS